MIKKLLLQVHYQKIKEEDENIDDKKEKCNKCIVNDNLEKIKLSAPENVLLKILYHLQKIIVSSVKEKKMSN